jgi:hypothetical protein
MSQAIGTSDHSLLMHANPSRKIPTKNYREDNISFAVTMASEPDSSPAKNLQWDKPWVTPS